MAHARFHEHEHDQEHEHTTNTYILTHVPSMRLVERSEKKHDYASMVVGTTRQTGCITAGELSTHRAQAYGVDTHFVPGKTIRVVCDDEFERE